MINPNFPELIHGIRYIFAVFVLFSVSAYETHETVFREKKTPLFSFYKDIFQTDLDRKKQQNVIFPQKTNIWRA